MVLETERIRILAADDEDAILRIYRKVLLLEPSGRDEGFKADSSGGEPLPDGGTSSGAGTSVELTLCRQGEEAVEAVLASNAESRPFAVVFLDVHMPPGLDGVEAAVRIRAADPHVQIVIVTAYSDLDPSAIARRVGSVDRLLYVQKPFHPQEMRQAAAMLGAKWLAERALLRANRELELRVQRRTAELVKVNEELKKETEDRVQMERQLLQARKLESIGQLAAGIAHEINTPTQYIGDNTRFLQDAFGALARLLEKIPPLLGMVREGRSDPEMIAQVERMVVETDLEYLQHEIPQAISQSLEGIERVSTIVRAMKEFSHPGVDQKKEIDLNRAVESTIEVSRNEWKYVAEMSARLEPALPMVRCVPGEINQVILNLIVNAAHAIATAIGNSPNRKGDITIATIKDGDWVEIRVSDTGCGIPLEIQDRIFDPFFTTKEVGKGSGQGLSISHHVIVKKHGGSISFETEVGKGTTFIIRLPIQDPPSPASARE